MLDSYTPYNFHKTRQILGAGGLAVLAKKYCIHLIYICLSHVMQLSKKTGHIGHMGLLPLKKILDSPHLHLTLTHYAIFVRNRS